MLFVIPLVVDSCRQMWQLSNCVALLNASTQSHLCDCVQDLSLPSFSYHNVGPADLMQGALGVMTGGQLWAISVTLKCNRTRTGVFTPQKRTGSPPQPLDGGAGNRVQSL